MSSAGGTITLGHSSQFTVHFDISDISLIFRNYGSGFRYILSRIPLTGSYWMTAERMQVPSIVLVLLHCLMLTMIVVAVDTVFTTYTS